MATLNDLKSSKFLKRSDVGVGVLVTITGVREENVAKEGAPEEWKYCLHFKEFDKPMVLNSTNGQILAKIFKTGDDDDIEQAWIGKQVVLYDDPNVSFGGKLTGGIRIRASRLQAPPAGQSVPQPTEMNGVDADDLLF